MEKNRPRIADFSVVRGRRLGWGAKGGTLTLSEEDAAKKAKIKTLQNRVCETCATTIEDWTFGQSKQKHTIEVFFEQNTRAMAARLFSWISHEADAARRLGPNLNELLSRLLKHQSLLEAWNEAQEEGKKAVERAAVETAGARYSTACDELKRKSAIGTALALAIAIKEEEDERPTDEWRFAAIALAVECVVWQAKATTSPARRLEWFRGEALRSVDKEAKTKLRAALNFVPGDPPAIAELHRALETAERLAREEVDGWHRIVPTPGTVGAALAALDVCAVGDGLEQALLEADAGVDSVLGDTTAKMLPGARKIPAQELVRRRAEHERVTEYAIGLASSRYVLCREHARGHVRACTDELAEARLYAEEDHLGPAPPDDTNEDHKTYWTRRALRRAAKHAVAALLCRHLALSETDRAAVTAYQFGPRAQKLTGDHGHFVRSELVPDRDEWADPVKPLPDMRMQAQSTSSFPPPPPALGEKRGDQ